MTESISVARMHDPRSGHKGRIHVDEFVEGRLARTARVSTNCKGDDKRFTDEQDSIVVSLEQAAICGKTGNVCGFGLRMRGNVLSRSEGEGGGGVNLYTAAGCVAQGVFTLCLVRIAGAVAEQSV